MERVQILMSTYNGEKYLREQIESIINQEGVDVSILVRDDGSTDSTISILDEYKKQGILDFYTGENLRPARSFMHLVMNAPESDYYALCDQDDVWLQGKLEKAVEALRNETGSALYYHGMNLVDSDLNKFGYYFRKEEYAQSLEYSCLFGDEIAGCTMVFNKQLLSEIKKYNPEFITMHDGWVHRVCLCVGGKIIGDQTPYINYRQHQNNAVGMGKRDLRKQFDAISRKENKFSRLAQEMTRGYGNYIKKNDLDFLNILTEYKNDFEYRLKLIKKGLVLKAGKSETVKLGIKILFGSL